jgi:hypothetical protein
MMTDPMATAPLLAEVGVADYAPDLLRDGLGYFYLYALQVRARAICAAAYRLPALDRNYTAPAADRQTAITLAQNAFDFINNVLHSWVHPNSARMLLAIGIDPVRRTTDPERSAISPDQTESKQMRDQHKQDMRQLLDAIACLQSSEMALLNVLLHGSPLNVFPSTTYFDPTLVMICWLDSVADSLGNHRFASTSAAPTSTGQMALKQHIVTLRRAGRFHGHVLGPSPNVPNAAWSNRAAMLVQNICNNSWAVYGSEGVPVKTAISLCAHFNGTWARMGLPAEALLLKKMTLAVFDGVVRQQPNPFLCRTYWQRGSGPSTAWLDRLLTAAADARHAGLRDPQAINQMKPEHLASHLRAVESFRVVIEELRSSFRDPVRSASSWRSAEHVAGVDDADQLMPLVDDDSPAAESAMDEWESLKELQDMGTDEIAACAKSLLVAIRRVEDPERQRTTVLNIIRALTSAFR